MASILLIEDELRGATALQKLLTEIGYDVRLARDGEAGLCTFESEQFDLVILDLSLPKIDGFVLCRIFRSKARYVPIIMLTGRTEGKDRVVGLEAGADEYLTKPVNYDELLARIKALLRLVEKIGKADQKPTDDQLRVGHLFIDLEKHTVVRDGIPIRLTAREFDLLAFLAQHPGKVFSRLQLLQEVWGYKHECYMHTVDSHVNRLRGKIEEHAAKPDVLLTVWGVGYKLNDHPNEHTHH